MIVLGIHDGHDAGVCLMRGGNELYCSSEERRRNIKNWSGVPEHSIREIFHRTGISPEDVDLIALSSMIRTTVPSPDPKLIDSVLRSCYSLARSETATAWGRWLLGKTRRRNELISFLHKMGMAHVPITTFDHHTTHAACAYYNRPWQGDAAVITLDGAGDGLCATVSVGRGQQLNVISQTPKFHSPAACFYSAITAHLGLKPNEHEYKVMGMAPYGRADYCYELLNDMFGVDGLRFRNRTQRIGPTLTRHLDKKLAGQRFDNISAACQAVFERMMVEWVGNVVKTTGIRRIAAAGGAFLNVKANKLIREMDGVDSLFVYPASDDGGTPIGAAILGHLELCRQVNIEPQLDLPRHMYLGVEYTEKELLVAAKSSGLPFERMRNVPRQVANILSSGKIVARFDGREEMGPRALGNRSILADPRDLRVIRKLNFAIKQRDFWMPFAASVLEEDAPKYVKRLSPWPYWMIEAFDTEREAENHLIAGLHPMDQTVRPQVVNQLNPGFRDIIRAFRNRTGVGGLLNTSFNLHGSPIVGSPEVAIDTLKHSKLDALALGPFLLKKAA